MVAPGVTKLQSSHTLSVLLAVFLEWLQNFWQAQLKRRGTAAASGRERVAGHRMVGVMERMSWLLYMQVSEVFGASRERWGQKS